MRLGQIGLWGVGGWSGVTVAHLTAQILLDNNVLDSILPQHLLPP